MGNIIQVKFPYKTGKRQQKAANTEAIVDVKDGSRLGFQFVSNFFDTGYLHVLSLEEAEAVSERQGYRKHDTTVVLEDENKFSTT